MSRGDDRRINDLENFEAAFLDALTRAKQEKYSAFISEKTGRKRGGATPLDVELFTLESKIDRLREKLGLPRFEIPLPKPEPSKGAEGWPPPPDVEATVFALDLQRIYFEIAQSDRTPEEIFTKVKYGGPKTRQGGDQSTWRLAMVEVGDGRIPAKLTLTVLPLPEHADAELAAHKLHQALDKLVYWSEKARLTPNQERPRLLNVGYARKARELSFNAR